ncbi:MAG: hypothetical protein KF799_00230 [Bdellovibrionales bacterium]|nr:hypothetical protein [Bdellovibrionales bacterium]
MKSMVLALTMLIGISAHAADRVIYTRTVSEPGLGSFRLKVVEPEEVMEPSYNRYMISVAVKCAGKPWEEIHRMPVCYFSSDRNRNEQVWDARNKLFSVYYSVIGLRPGPAQCTSHKVDEFDLRAACE